MLIADEVQTGAGRTGTFFAMEQMGVAADITTFAKSIAGGFPLSGITGRAEMMDAIGPGGLGGTYGGNPLACAAALAVIETFEKEQLLARANQVGTVIKEALGKLQQEYDFIADVRGLGAWWPWSWLKTVCRSRSTARESLPWRGSAVLSCFPVALMAMYCVSWCL